MARLALILISMAFLAGCQLHKAPAPPPQPPPAENPGGEHTDVLIYGGAGSWADEIESIKEILYAHGKTYIEFDDDQFNDLDEDDLEMFSLVIFPGGDSDKVTENLTPETRESLRKAVTERGLNYLGFCAGAWLVVSPDPKPGEDRYGLQLMTGPWLKHTPYYDQALPYAVALAEFPDGSRRKLLWFGGPVTPDIPGGVIAKYPDGSPAITQMKIGKGFAIISGLHPTANKRILASIALFEKEAITPDLGWEIVDAAIRGEPLPAFSQ